MVTAENSTVALAGAKMLTYDDYVALTPPLDVVFTPNDTLQPDILFMPTARLPLIGDKKIEGAPDLVVEVLSYSNKPKERKYKKHVYETCGVRECWLVDLEQESVGVYRNNGQTLVHVGDFGENEVIVSEALVGFRLEVAELLNL